MTEANANINYCGIINLLLSLRKHGFTESEIRKIAARVAVKTGADIILFG